jgi:hypothetical protein
MYVEKTHRYVTFDPYVGGYLRFKMSTQDVPTNSTGRFNTLNF